MDRWRPFRHGLERTRQAIAAILGTDRGHEAEAWEEALLGADLAVEDALAISARAAQARPAERARVVRDGLRELAGETRPLALVGEPAVIVMVGVNGAGKTTTLGKLVHRLTGDGKKVTVAAADTFRAAAVEQVTILARREGADVVAQGQGADAAAVAFDALARARATRSDVLLVDTAGRLHTRTPLMDELRKVVGVVSRALGRDVDEVLLVLDGTSGQNAISQAESFSRALGITGLVVTKLDASAKGGAALSARRRLGVPIRLVGVGEGPDDLGDFDPEAYVDALLGEETP